jgi:hypothetical protein
MTPGLTQQFTAVVAGTGVQAVNWELDGAGTLSTSGSYSTPSTITDPAVVLISATASGMTGSAQVFLFPTAPNAVSVTPSMTTTPLGPSEKQQFSGALGTEDTFTWSTVPATGAGSVDQTGLYTAPATIDASQTVLVLAVSTVASILFGIGIVTLAPSSDG